MTMKNNGACPICDTPTQYDDFCQECREIARNYIEAFDGFKAGDKEMMFELLADEAEKLANLEFRKKRIKKVEFNMVDYANSVAGKKE